MGALLMAIGNTGAWLPRVVIVVVVVVSHHTSSRSAYEHTNKVVVNSY